MNEGQRQYSYEQWMLSRVRAGQRFTPPPLSGDERDRSPIRGGGTDSDTYPDDYIPRTPGRDIPELQEHSDHSIVRVEDSLPSTSHRNNDQIPDPIDVDMASHSGVPDSVGNPAGTGNDPETNGAGGEPPNKKAKTGGASSKKLPGTAKPQSLEGTGDRSIVYLERPINPKNIVITTYKKQHKLLTFGIASKILNQKIAAVDNVNPAHVIYFLTTALAEVPVHKPVLYMNQSEYDLLPIGAEVLQVKVSVVQRNALLSFQTNASSTSLATLNQNKNGVYCIGLNKTGYGTNRRYTAFNATEKMIPEKCGPPVYAAVAEGYEGMLEDLYGVNNNVASFVTSLPKHQVGMYTTLKNYFCMTQTSLYTGGWPNLQSKVVEYDAAAVVGEPILTYVYQPKIAPLKPVQKYLPTQLPYRFSSEYVHGTLQSGFEVMTKNNTDTTKDVSYSSSNPRANIDMSFDIYTDIEKSQCMVRGIGGNMTPQIQPSLHIGINPVPALTTAAITGGDTNSSFTDTRSYFDVTCECVVGYRTYTDRPFASEYNCAAGEEIRGHNGKSLPFDSNTVPFAGLYVNASLSEQ